MLVSKPTPKGTGIEFWGDYDDLSLLHSTVHKIANKIEELDSPSSKQSLILMNFAYEIRKAFEGSRLLNKEKVDLDGNPIYFGFQFLWVDLLFTISILRNYAGFEVLDELDQANLYILEYQTKSSLEDYDLKGARFIKLFIGQKINIRHDLVYQMLQAINFEYLSSKPTKTRFRNIPNLIIGYNSEFSETFKLWKKELDKNARELNCTSNSIELDEYPEFEW